eukprot:NODE_289_length_11662_cov_0.555133.p4 type:complete len:205 gc:universal NODE_289_length_11662_cov_0.555133:10727-10113(-)
MFAQRKKSVMEKLDKSNKQSIDHHLIETCNAINNMENYFTTSCCSGRVVLMTKTGEKLDKKLSGKWLLVSHDPPNIQDYFKDFNPVYMSDVVQNPTERVILKYEPVIMHVACRDMESAVVLHNASFNAGFRNSGISCDLKQSRFTVAIRCTINLEIEVGYFIEDSLHLVFTDRQFLYLHNQIVSKFECNFILIGKLNRVINSLK